MQIKIIESPVKSEKERQKILKYIHSQGSGWSKFYQELTKKDLFYKHWHIVMEEDERFIGHCHICQSIKHPELAMFGFLEVDKNFRGQGIAKNLYQQSMKILENEAAELVMLGTGFENPARKYIYLKDGFRDIFVGPEGDVLMAMVFQGKLQDYLKNYFAREKEKGIVREIKYGDYLEADLIMNLKFGEVKDKNNLPLNAHGKHGGYVLFRDHSLLIHRIKIREIGGRVVDVVIEGLYPKTKIKRLVQL